MSRGTLILFVKAPRLGAVKTRLAASIGSIAAWRFYRSMLARLWRRFGNDRRWRVILAVSPDNGMAPWPADFQRQGQGQGDLGRRMANALASQKGPAVLVGGEIPDLDDDHIAQAFQALRRAPVVFGPAKDGGFWLIGLRRGERAHRLFTNVRWSSPQTLTDCLANLPASTHVALLDYLNDVDDLSDYRAYQKATGR